MSFILDALKKSEAERQRQAGPALLEMRVMRPQRRIAPWVLIVGGVLILLNLAGMLWLFLRPAAHAPATATPAGAAAPAGTLAAAPPASTSTLAPGTAASPDGMPQLAPGERLIGPGGTVSTVSQVPLLAGDNGAVTLPGGPRGGAGAVGPGAIADDGAVNANVNPADYVPAAPSGTRTRTAGLRSYSDVSNVVPPMRLDLHVFDAVPARRYAFINMKKVHEGEATGDGTQVIEITRDGVVLAYRNTEFLLTSDSSAPAAGAAP